MPSSAQSAWSGREGSKGGDDLGAVVVGGRGQHAPDPSDMVIAAAEAHPSGLSGQDADVRCR